MLLSVIVSTRNRAQLLAGLLDSLAAQDDTAFKWEVVVVDNGSTDQTRETVYNKINEFPILIRYIFESNVGLHHGRHRGAKEARGVYLGYLDDDVVLGSEWISAVNNLINGEADAIGGRVLPLWKAPPADWLSIFWNDCKDGRFCTPLSLIDLGEKAIENISPYYIFGCNFFISKRTLFDLGGFHPDSMPKELLRFRGNGETALMLKLRDKGLVGMYDPKATVYHIIPSERLSIEYFCQRHFMEGISASYTHIRANCGIKPSHPHLHRPLEIPSSFIGIWHLVEEAYRQGWEFHQNEVKSDHALLDYVLRPRYIE